MCKIADFAYVDQIFSLILDTNYKLSYLTFSPSSSDVEHWTVGDVSDWLISAQLHEYSPSFMANEISGPVLLDVTLDDLDYIGVVKLGHRKIILKSIEDLRKNKRITLNLVASHESSKISQPTIGNIIGNTMGNITENIANDLTFESNSPEIPSSSRNNNEDKSESKNSNPANSATVHWSHLEPLSTHQVSQAFNFSTLTNIYLS